MQDGNIIIADYHSDLCIIEIKNFYEQINQVYKFPKIHLYFDYGELNELIIRVIETNNKNVVVLTSKNVLFYYNKILQNNGKENENNYLYDYSEYSRIKQKDGDKNISILE